MKKIFAIVISLILVFSLVACTSGKDNESTEATTEVVSTVETDTVATTEAPVETGSVAETEFVTEAPVESTADVNG